jgi:hypothetical protein
MLQSHFSPSIRKKGKKTKSGPRPTPTGLRPRHPERGGMEGGNALQHETQAVAQEQTERCTSPEANTQEPTGTASSATEAPTKRTNAATTEQTASRREQEQPCRKERGSRSQGMQCARTKSASKESTCSARRTRSRAGDSCGSRSHRSAQTSVGSGQECDGFLRMNCRSRYKPQGRG